MIDWRFAAADVSVSLPNICFIDVRFGTATFSKTTVCTLDLTSKNRLFSLSLLSPENLKFLMVIWVSLPHCLKILSVPLIVDAVAVAAELSGLLPIKDTLVSSSHPLNIDWILLDTSMCTLTTDVSSVHPLNISLKV